MAVVSGKGGCLGHVSLATMPVDVWVWLHDFLPLEFALIEKVASSPQMGVKSAFTFGASYGAVRAFLVAAGVPFEEVSPGVWQKAMGVPKRDSSDIGAAAQKNRTKARAGELFPGVRCTHGNSDALLLAEYARRKSAERSR